MGHDQHTVAVLAPVLYLTVTIESTSAGNDEIHIHPGGQGFWVARMLKHLSERPLLCGPLGGEPGRVFLGLLGQFGMNASRIEIAHPSPVLVSDRRSGQRVIIADSPTVSLERHEIDDMYGRFLDRALAARLCVVTGQAEEIVPRAFFRRLGYDLASAGIRVVADLHGPERWSFLDGGPIQILKISDEDLVQDGLVDGEDPDRRSLMRAIDEVVVAGARAVVLSRQDRPVLAWFDDGWFEARTPELDPADRRGAGDSMTAGLAAALLQSLETRDLLRLAGAAGAANVTRHGLGSADAELIPGLIKSVTVRRLAKTPA